MTGLREPRPLGRSSDLAPWILLAAIAGGIALVLVGALRHRSHLVQPVGLALLGGGLFGGWLLTTSRLLVSSRGSALHEIGVASLAAGPASLLVGLGLAWSTRRSLAPASVLFPELATITTPVLVGCLATLAWRLRPRAVGADDT